MKKLLCGMLSLLILLSLAGCEQKQAVDTNMTPNEIAESIARSQTDLPELIQITSADADFSTWVSDYYQISAEQVEDGAIFYADGVKASEIAVLVLTNQKNAEAARATLSKYIESRTGIFEGYAPQQAALAKGGIVSVNGKYVALLICKDTSAAKAAFLNCFGDTAQNPSEAETILNPSSEAETEPASEAKEGTGITSVQEETEEPVTVEDYYSTESVLRAWRSGDTSRLSEESLCVLHAAEEVIRQEITDDMSDYEKELAIHDWITDWCSFDYSVFGRSSDGFTDGSNTPYGVLIDRSAMCHGYSSTFQLFMDMLDIECMTVFGIPGSNGVEHSWNQVKLDGEWYCVDCAWDDPIGGSPCHTYFNVTSDYLRSGSIHRWDESAVPEASGTAWAYGKH